MKSVLNVLKADAPLPQLWGVLYAPPNANGQRKACANCMLKDNAQATICKIVRGKISPEMVCGYHVAEGGVKAVDAGLETVQGGTSCDRCKYFDDGECEAVLGNDGNHAKVNAKGCCARWERK